MEKVGYVFNFYEHGMQGILRLILYHEIKNRPCLTLNKHLSMSSEPTFILLDKRISIVKISMNLL